MKQQRDPEFYIEPLSDRYDRTTFSCGIDALDRYLQKHAGQDLRKKVAAVFVLTSDGTTIAGFYSLAAHAVDLPDLPPEIARQLPRYPAVPTTLLGRLAVSLDFRGRRFGELLLMDALRRALMGSRQVASAAVVVDAKDEAAREFYLHYAFIPLPARKNRLFCPMKTIEKLFA